VSTPGTVCLIANPASGRGRGARLLPAIREALAARGVTDIRVTAAAGDERRLARQAAAAGVDTVIALGGDGTWGNAARGILESGKRARLALLAAGTGNDFAHALGLTPGDMRRMLQISLDPGSTTVDLGLADGTPFVNVAGFGVETSVIEAARHVPLLRGHLLYFAAAVPKLFTYRPLVARATDDGERNPGPSKYLALVIANGPRFGGGFRIAPAASLADGLLDFVAVGDAGVARRVALLARVRAGRHAAEPEVEMRQIRSLGLEFDQPTPMDLDGEVVRTTSKHVSIECLPGALTVATSEVGGPRSK
jgi:diacylglycerol kinase (ATP)